MIFCRQFGNRGEARDGLKRALEEVHGVLQRARLRRHLCVRCATIERVLGEYTGVGSLDPPLQRDPLSERIRATPAADNVLVRGSGFIGDPLTDLRGFFHVSTDSMVSIAIRLTV